MGVGDLSLEHVSQGVALLTLDRPDSLNAITMAMQERLDGVLADLAEDGTTRCVVLTGAGERAFSAGYDVHEMAGWTADEQPLRLRERERWLLRFAETPLPVIAALAGITYGAGALLAAAADVRYGAESTELKFTAAAYNGANATWTLPRLVGHGQASELLLSARPVGAEEACRIGLLNRVCDDPVADACALAGQIAGNPPDGTREIKRLLRASVGTPVRGAFEAESLAMRTRLAPRPMQETFSEGNGDFEPTSTKRPFRV